MTKGKSNPTRIQNLALRKQNHWIHTTCNDGRGTTWKGPRGITDTFLNDMLEFYLV